MLGNNWTCVDTAKPQTYTAPDPASGLRTSCILGQRPCAALSKYAGFKLAQVLNQLGDIAADLRNCEPDKQYRRRPVAIVNAKGNIAAGLLQL